MCVKFQISSSNSLRDVTRIPKLHLGVLRPSHAPIGKIFIPKSVHDPIMLTSCERFVCCCLRLCLVFFNAYPVCQNKINQHWLTMQVTTTTWSSGWHQQSWTGNLTGAPGGSRRRYIYERRDGFQWTGMKAATHWATHTTNFLPCHITTVARTGRRTEQASSDEGLWERSKRQGKNMSGWDMK